MESVRQLPPLDSKVARSAVGEFGRPREFHTLEIVSSNLTCATQLYVLSRPTLKRSHSYLITSAKPKLVIANRIGLMNA